MLVRERRITIPQNIACALDAIIGAPVKSRFSVGDPLIGGGSAECRFQCEHPLLAITGLAVDMRYPLTRQTPRTIERVD